MSSFDRSGIATSKAPADVVFGGARVDREKQLGNIRYSKLLQEFAKDYHETSIARHKSNIVNHIMTEIENHGGRFLRSVASEATSGKKQPTAWYLIEPSKVVRKVKHDLRTKGRPRTSNDDSANILGTQNSAAREAHETGQARTESVRPGLLPSLGATNHPVLSQASVPPAPHDFFQRTDAGYEVRGLEASLPAASFAYSALAPDHPASRNGINEFSEQVPADSSRDLNRIVQSIRQLEDGILENLLILQKLEEEYEQQPPR